MENSITRRRSWRPWCWKKNQPSEPNLDHSSSVLQPVNVIPQSGDIDAESAIELPKKRPSLLRSCSLSLILGRSPEGGSPTPNFDEIPATIVNSMLVSSYWENEHKLALSTGREPNTVSMFNDEHLLYFPHQKEAVESGTAVQQNITNRKPKSEADANKSPSGPFTVRNMLLPSTVKYSGPQSRVFPKEPSLLWNMWVQVSRQGRTNLQVKKKVFDRPSVEELANDYDYILEFYVHDKGQRLFLWPFGQGKPPVGRLKRLSTLIPFVFWVPLASGSACWYAICKLLLFKQLPFNNNIAGVGWRGEPQGYWLTLYAKDCWEEEETRLFLNELALSMVLTCGSETQSVLLQRIFSATRTVNGSEAVSVVTV